MAQTPVSVQLFDSFLGAQEGIHSIILPDIFSSGGAKNLWIDKYGRAKRILGYTAANSSAVTTDTGGSATLVRSLFAYRKTSGGSVTRQLLGIFDDGVDEHELWKSTDDGATWTFVFDWGSSAVGQTPDFGQMGDTLIITNGKVAPKAWDGTTLSTAGGTQSPTITSAASSSSGNLKGHYKWKLVSMVSGVRQIGSAASTSLLLVDKKADLSWTQDANASVTGYEIYRTTGTGEVYYYITTIDGRATVSYTDNYGDGAILENRIMEEHGDAPPTTYYVEPHSQLMWYFRTDANPQRGYWSDPGDPDSVLSTNFLDFADAETQGDAIVGARGDHEGMLVVFETRSVWTVTGSGRIIGNVADWTRSRTNAQTGAISGRTVVRVPAGAKYMDQDGKPQTIAISALAYLTPLLDIRIFDGDNDIVISHPKKEQLSTLNYAFGYKSFAVQDIERCEVTWIYPDGSAGEPNKAVTWNYRWGVWYEREWAFSHAIACDTTSDSSILLAGSNSTSTGGKVYLLWNGNSAAGANFRAQWMSKTFYGVNDQGKPAISNRKRWRWADFMLETERSVTLTIEWLEGDSPDNGSATSSSTFAPGTATLVTMDGDTILTAGGDSIVVSAASGAARVQFKDATGDYMHHRGIRLRIYDDAQNGSWSLEGFNLGYQILDGLKRDVGAF